MTFDESKEAAMRSAELQQTFSTGFPLAEVIYAWTDKRATEIDKCWWQAAAARFYLAATVHEAADDLPVDSEPQTCETIH